MITIRKSEDRGHADFGWLDTHHTFSFGDYRDPAHMGFRSLRVINDDLIAAGMGFGTHPHADMEIISYVVEGALAHKDSMGTGSVIRPGDVQQMSAGTGVEHSEFNPSKTERTRLIQIWIRPDRKGHTPRYQQKTYPAVERADKLRLVASPDGAEGSIEIHQDAKLYATTLTPGASVKLDLANNRHAWVQVVKGSLALNGQELKEGDGAAISDESAIALKAKDKSEVLVFDLA